MTAPRVLNTDKPLVRRAMTRVAPFIPEDVISDIKARLAVVPREDLQHAAARLVRAIEQEAARMPDALDKGIMRAVTAAAAQFALERLSEPT